MLQFTYIFQIAGVHADPYAIALEDVTATFGIKRLDTDAVVVAPGTAWVHDSTGHYHYNVSSPASGVTYRVAVKTQATPSSPVLYDELDKLDSSLLSAWTYADESDVVDAIAAANLQILSNLSDTDLTTDHARIQRAGDWSDAYINSRLGKTIYTTPLAAMDADTTLLLVECSVHLVIWRLYQHRGVKDLDPEKVPVGIAGLMENHKKLADMFLEDVQSGDMTISATTKAAIPTKLSVVAPDPVWIDPVTLIVP